MQKDFVFNFRDVFAGLLNSYATLVARRQQPGDAKSTRLYQTVESRDGSLTAESFRMHFPASFNIGRS
jgi:hypothetical protein